MVPKLHLDLIEIAGAEEVVIDGAPYVQYGADRGGRKLEAGPLQGKVVSEIDVPPLARVARQPDVMPLYDVEGNLKLPGDAPIRVCLMALMLGASPIIYLDRPLVQAILGLENLRRNEKNGPGWRPLAVSPGLPKLYV